MASSNDIASSDLQHKSECFKKVGCDCNDKLLLLIVLGAPA